MAETKLLGLFLRTAQDLRTTDRYNFSYAITKSSSVGATELRNPFTDAAFYVVEHPYTNDTTPEHFKLSIRSESRGNLTIPQFSDNILIDGRQTKILPVDFTFGDNKLVYSTAEVLSHSVIDGESVLALWLPEGESGEFRVFGGSQKREVVSGTGGSFHVVGDDLVVAYKQQSNAQSVLQFDSFRVILLPRKLAYKFWAPTLSSNPLVHDDDVVFVTGPYLVRSVSINGAQVAITGDVDTATSLEVWAPASAESISWNGRPVSTTKTSYGTLKANLAPPSIDSASLEKTLSFASWKFSQALPEIEQDYNDSGDAWVHADLMTSPNPTKPITFPSLYADEYGFHTGVILFRGRFNDIDVTAVNLTVQGGTAFGWSAYVNGEFIGADPGNTTATKSSRVIAFSNATLGENNVLTVVMDHSGHNQRAEALFPRGILGASLISNSPNATFSKWVIAGNAGGEANIDPVRGAIAEGGLYAERLGWHLPGFDDSAWETRSPSEGIDDATIGFFRTSLDLHVPEGIDAPLAFVLRAPPGSILRAQLYVNGYVSNLLFLSNPQLKGASADINMGSMFLMLGIKSPSLFRLVFSIIAATTQLLSTFGPRQQQVERLTLFLKSLGYMRVPST